MRISIILYIFAAKNRKMKYRWIVIVCLVLFAQCIVAQEEACREDRILFHDDFGGNAPDDPMYYTESHPNIINYTNGGGQHIERGMYTITKKGLQTGDWHIQDDYTFPDDYTRGYFLEIDGNGTNDQFYVVQIDHLFTNEKLHFSARVANVNITNQGNECPSVQIVVVNADTDERLDSVSTGCIEADKTAAKDESAAWQLLEMDYIVPLDVSSIKMYLYNDAITITKFGNDFAVDDIDISYIVGCQKSDTAICDTLLPFYWQGHEWKEPGTITDTLRDQHDLDSVYLHYIVDTFHCERLYPIIVNKYNWQLLCDNVALRRFFSQTTPVSFQWYKNGVPIYGANIDDYSERNELHGSYQLRVEMSDGTYVWSDIIEIPDTRVPSPVRVQIYDSRGVPVRENQVRHGIYLYRYEQDDHVWTEKKLIQ